MFLIHVYSNPLKKLFSSMKLSRVGTRKSKMDNCFRPNINCNIMIKRHYSKLFSIQITSDQLEIPNTYTIMN